MFKIIPIENKTTIKLDPPYEISGNGIPVKGNNATIEPRLIIICVAINTKIPLESK